MGSRGNSDCRSPATIAHSRIAGANVRVASEERKKDRSSVLRYFVVAYFRINLLLGILLVVVDMLHGGVPISPNGPRSWRRQ